MEPVGTTNRCQLPSTCSVDGQRYQLPLQPVPMGTIGTGCNSSWYRWPGPMARFLVMRRRWRAPCRRGAGVARRIVVARRCCRRGGGDDGAGPRRGDTGPGDRAGEEEPAQPGDGAGGLLRRAPQLHHPGGAPRQGLGPRRRHRRLRDVIVHLCMHMELTQLPLSQPRSTRFWTTTFSQNIYYTVSFCGYRINQRIE